MDKIIAKCSSSLENCQECGADYSTCTKCIDTFNFKTISGTTKKCVSRTVDNEDNKGYGLDKTVTSPPTDVKDMVFVSCKSGLECERCLSDYESCDSCKTNTVNRYLYIYSGTKKKCVQNVANYGVDLESAAIPELKKCDVLKCIACADNYKKCSQCDTGYSLASDTSCIEDAKVCKATGCKACDSDPKKCSECQPNKLLKTDDGSCYSQTEDVAKLTGYGVSTSPLGVRTFEKCVSYPNCNSCIDDSTSCTACNTNYKLYKDPAYGGKGKCIQTLKDDTDNKGLGQDSTKPTELFACLTSQNCKTCLSNFKSCESCDPNRSNPYLFKAADGSYGCIAAVEGKGKDLDVTLPTLKDCEANLNCKTCEDNYKKCKTCKITGEKYLKEDDSKCVTSIDSGYGLKNPTGADNIIAKCSSSLENCQECGADYSTCTKCIDTFNFKTISGTTKKCVSRTVDNEDNLGYGLDKTSGTDIKDMVFVSCKSGLECERCLSDYESCDSCKMKTVNRYLFIYSGTKKKCVQSEAKYGVDLESAALPELKKCDSSLNCELCSDNYKQCETCSSGYFMNPSGDCEQGLPPSGQCKATGCTKCATSLDKCETCQDNMFLKTDDGSCYSETLDATKLTGYGISTSATGVKTFEKCVTYPYCNSCIKDNTSCTACNTNYKLFTDVSSGGKTRCIQVYGDNTDNQGKGINPASPDYLSECTKSKNCLTCLSNYDSCQSCNTGTSSTYKYLYESTDAQGVKTKSCVSITKGKGKDLLTTGLPAVKDCEKGLDCDSCNDNYKYCSSCASGKVVRNDGACVTANSPVCTASGCKTCSTPSKCSSCIDDRYILTDSGSCYALDQDDKNLKGYGLSTTGTTTTFEKCTSSLNCLTCLNDVDSCDACPDNFKFYVTNGKNSCIQSNGDTVQNKNKGVNKANTDYLIDCLKTKNCLTCLSDSSSCESCDTTTKFKYLFEETINSIVKRSCVESNNGKGRDLDTDGLPSVKLCLSSNCKTCDDNYKKCKTCIPNFKMVDDSKACTDTAPPGYGLKNFGIDDDRYVPCESLLNCATCGSNYQACENCKSGDTLKDDDKSCKTKAPAGYGLKNFGIAGNKFVPCDPAYHCATCENSYQVCQTCQTGFNLLPLGTKCASRTEDNDDNRGYGLDLLNNGPSLDSRKFVSCLLGKNCKTCLKDYTSCESCDSTKASKYMYTVTSGTSQITSCEASSNGFGRDLDSSSGLPRVQKCIDTLNCATCDDNYKKCKTCSSTMSLYTDATGTTMCVTSNVDNDDNKGKGKVPNFTPSTLKDCLPTLNCERCLGDNTKCSSCQSGYNLYTNGNTKKCLSRSEDNPDNLGKGLDTNVGNSIAAYPFVACQTSLNCLTCRMNKDSCDTCDTSKSFFLYVSASDSVGKCIEAKTDTAANNRLGRYMNPTTGLTTLKECAEGKGCETCLNDYTRCTSCPAGSGKVVRASDGFCVAATVKDCTAKNCAACTDKVSVCSTCISGTTLLPDSGSCYTSEEVKSKFPGYGLKTGTAGAVDTYVKCKSGMNCKDCLTDYSVCLSCDTNYKFFEDLVDKTLKTCIPYTENMKVNEKKGQDPLRTDYLISCNSNLNCLTCLKSANSCESCDQTSTLKYLLATTSGTTTTYSCVPNTLGYGRDLALVTPPTVQSCLQKLNCATCNENYKQCETCKQDWSLYTNTNDETSCIYSRVDSETNTGKGLVTGSSPSRLVDCDSSLNCATCLGDHTKCYTCMQGFNLYSSTKKCITRASTTDENRGKGLVTSSASEVQNRLFDDCDKNKNCLTCLSDNSKCESCDNTKGSYLYEATSTCVLMKERTKDNTGLGFHQLKTGIMVVQACESSQGCATCFADFSICETCKNPDFVVDPIDGACKASIPVSNFQPVVDQGTGIDHETGRPVKCAETYNCKTCPDNYKKCTSCYDGFEIDGDVCKPTEVQIIPAKPNEFKITAVFKIVVTKVDTDNLSFTINDQAGSTSYNCPPSECRAVKNPDNNKAIDFILQPQINALRGQLVVKREKKRILQSPMQRVLAEDTLDPFATPYIINDVQFSRTGESGDSYIAVYTTLNSYRVIGMYILMVLLSNRVFFTTEVFATLYYLSLVEGPFIAHTERTLGLHSDWKLMVIDFGNPFGKWDGFCQASNEHPKNKLFCNFMTNYGQNFIILMIILGVALLAYLIFRLLAPKQETEKPQLPEGTTKVDANLPVSSSTSTTSIIRARRLTLLNVLWELSFPHFNGLLDALKLPILILALENFRNCTKSGYMAMGMIVSIIAVTYYIATTIISFKLIEMVLRALEPIRQSLPQENREVLLEEAVDFRTARLGSFSHLVRGIKVPSSMWQLLNPFISHMRAFFIATLIVFFPDNPNAACSFIMIAEIAMLFYRLLTFKAQETLVYALSNTLYSALTIAYLLLKLVSISQSISEVDRQTKVGVAMAVMVVGLWILIFLDTAFDAVYVFRRMYKTAASKTFDVPAIPIAFYVDNSPEEEVLKQVPPPLSSSRPHNVKRFESPILSTPNDIDEAPVNMPHFSTLGNVQRDASRK